MSSTATRSAAPLCWGSLCALGVWTALAPPARAVLRDQDTDGVVHLAELRPGQRLYFSPTGWLPAGLTPADRDGLEKAAAALDPAYFVVFVARLHDYDTDAWLMNEADDIVSDWTSARGSYSPETSTVVFIGWSDGCELPRRERGSGAACEHVVSSRLTASDPDTLSGVDMAPRSDERRKLDAFSLDSPASGTTVSPDVAAFEDLLRSVVGLARRETAARRYEARAMEKSRRDLDEQVAELQLLLTHDGAPAGAEAGVYSTAITQAALDRNSASAHQLAALATRAASLIEQLTDAIAANQRHRTRVMMTVTALLALGAAGGYAGARLHRARRRDLESVRPWELALSAAAVRLAESDAGRAEAGVFADLTAEQRQMLDCLAAEGDNLALLVQALGERVALGRALAERSVWARSLGGINLDLHGAFEIDSRLIQGSRILPVDGPTVRLLPDDLIRRIREAFSDHEASWRDFANRQPRRTSS